MNVPNQPKFAPKFALLVGLLFCAAATNAHAVFLRGNPFTPTDANFQIFAVQGIDSSTPTGKTGFNPQVNGDFEFQGSTGVSYDLGNGQLKDFGIGLYSNSQNQIQATGLNIRYNQAVDASSVTITVEDFDISTKSTFFNPNKVEPTILLFGANGNVIASASPTDIFPNLTPDNSAGKKSSDVWNLNFGQLLSTLHLQDTSISGFLLSADMTHGERPNSDPYLLIAVGNAIPAVPEMATLFPIIGLIVAVVSTHALRRRKMNALAALRISSK